MHACMQFHVYLSGPHYTWKVATVDIPTNMPIATGDFKYAYSVAVRICELEH